MTNEARGRGAQARVIDANARGNDELIYTWHHKLYVFALLFRCFVPTTMSSATPAEPQATLRQRRVERRSSSDETIIHTQEEARDDKRDEVVWGKTPSGEGTSRLA